MWERIRTPVQIALAAGAVAVVLSFRNRFLLLGIVAAVFVLAVIVRNLYVSARKAADRWEIGLPSATLRVMRNDTGYWGGQIAHFGVALLALGIAISANQSVEAEVALSPGETATIAGYDITYVDRFTRDEPNRLVTGAEVEVSRNGRVVARPEPRINQYGSTSQAIATPAVDTSLTGDLYLSLKSINDSRIILGVWWFPYIWLIWLGGLLAGAAVLWSRLVRKPAREPVVVAQGAGDGA